MESAQRRNVIWNALAGIINAGEAIVVLAVVSRVNGLREAGIVTIAFSFANLFMTIGKFGMRNYQVAHGGYDISFKTFFIARIISTILMIAIAFIYVLLCFSEGKYSLDKAQVIFWISMWYALEAFEDVFAGQFQIENRLDIGSKIFIGRWILTILSFIIFDIITKNLVLSVFFAFAVGFFSGLIFILYTNFKYRHKIEIKMERGLLELFRNSVPLCISSFAYYYVTNVPKYVINTILTDEVQAIYGYISMPIFVISLLNSFIYQPQLIQYVLEWRENKIKQFINRIVRQLIMVIGIVLICLVGAYILGIPVLSMLYHENLTEYRLHLLVLLIGGSFLAIAGFCANMLTIIDEQRKAMYIYLIAAVIGQVMIYQMVQGLGLWGAVWGYVFTMLLMALMFGVTLIKTIQERQRECQRKKQS